MKQECPHCGKQSAVVPFDYLCQHCEKPLNELVNNNSDRSVAAPRADNSGFKLTEKDRSYDPTHIGSPHSGGGHEPTHYAGGNNSIGGYDATHYAGNDAGKTAYVPKNIPKYENVLKKGFIPVAWLVVHTEGELAVTYDIFEGENFFGRAAENYAVDIPIDKDNYVSRAHACIRVKKDQLGRFFYELLDQGLRRNGQSSTNGTYINSNKDRLNKDSFVALQDQDTIQVGLTKLVFKTQAKNYMEAATSVMQTDYQKTVFFQKP